jgi:integrase
LIKALLLPAPIAQKQLAAIDDGDINRFLGELMKRKGLNGQPIGPRRINMMIARLRTILSIAKRRKLISEDPMIFVKNLREPKGDDDPFTLEEAERLIKTATGQDRARLTVLVLCGLRPNEALALHWKMSTSITNNSGFDAASIALPASGCPRPHPANARSTCWRP